MCAFTSNRMLASELEFELPPELTPSPQPTGGTGLVSSSIAGGKELSHHYTPARPFASMPPHFPKRRFGTQAAPTLENARPEDPSNACSFVRKEHLENTWRCLLKPGGKTARTGKFFLPDEYEATVLGIPPLGRVSRKFDLAKG